jgi:transcriptional regulator CtsR
MSNINAVPNLPEVRERSRENQVKAATPDLIVKDKNGQPIEYLTDLLYEQIGGQEILSVSRAEIINGQNVTYSPISNLTSISTRYNSQNIYYVDGTWEEYFSNFAIKLENYLPDFGSGPLGQIIYIEQDGETANLVIEFQDVPENIEVEVQTAFTSELFSDIIYGMEEES